MMDHIYCNVEDIYKDGCTGNKICSRCVKCGRHCWCPMPKRLIPVLIVLAIVSYPFALGWLAIETVKDWKNKE